MNNKANYLLTALLTTSILFMFVVSPLTGFFEHRRLALNLAMLGTFVCFIILLELKQDRVLKGIFLIGFGVLYQLIYPKYLFVFVDKTQTPQDALEHFEVVGQVMLLACSGAGGSIIALHADKSSSDNESVIANVPMTSVNLEKAVLDNTTRIEQLIKTTEQLLKSVNALLATALGIMIMMVLLAIIISG
ncbi:hypothetical protein FGE05_26040 [Pseudomonas sp. ICMP22404]|uniref:hypothetical protein n=1 Tax=Pseudomonas sp. ICMP22404 TaxID=2583807 RepID=UPI0011181FD7|nr:hypothetical protein [Pseudomonas sp. ICMP22404]TNF79318.1 hypothetical protein FGE05_26040 [Pseudomonas sp. ICMP22404]